MDHACYGTKRTSAVLFAATLVASSSAIDFGEDDITQSAGTVAPGGEMQTSTAASGESSFGNTHQWTQTASSSNNVPSAATSESQGWTMSTESPSAWTPTSGQASGSANQGWTPPTSTDASNAWAPSSAQGSIQGGYSLECSGSSDESHGLQSRVTSHTGYSLECSGSDEGVHPSTDYSLECSGSDEDTPTMSTATAGSSNTTPTATTAATSAASGEYEDALQTASTKSSGDAASTTSSGTTDQGWSQGTQTSTASSPNTASSSTTESSSNTASSSTQEGSDATQTSGNSTSSGAHATFGTITSKSGECVFGNPDAYVSTADIDWIWKNRIGPDAPTRDANWNVMDNKNWIMDHIVHNKGSLNYCVRWDSTEKLTKTVASKFQAMLERQYAAWNEWLIGYDCWPYDEIKVNLVGFAVKDASLLDWTDDSLGTITAGNLDSNGVPQCDQSCYRFYDNGPQAWSDTSSCKVEPFDISLWPKQGLEGGYGYDWGQEVNLENMLQTIDEDQLVIVAHEIGHGFGLPDFYEDADKPNAQWPNCIMMAGSSMTVTPSDGWMVRRVLEHIKSRYNF